MGSFDLTGQTAIVTGAAAAIGEAIARRLSKAGAFVVISGPGESTAAEPHTKLTRPVTFC